MRAMVRNLFILEDDTRQPPTSEEFTVGMKAEVDIFRLKLLLPRRLPV